MAILNGSQTFTPTFYNNKGTVIPSYSGGECYICTDKVNLDYLIKMTTGSNFTANLLAYFGKGTSNITSSSTVDVFFSSTNDFNNFNNSTRENLSSFNISSTTETTKTINISDINQTSILKLFINGGLYIWFVLNGQSRAFNSIVLNYSINNSNSKIVNANAYKNAQIFISDGKAWKEGIPLIVKDNKWYTLNGIAIT